jgi:cytochrome c553
MNCTVGRQAVMLTALGLLAAALLQRSAVAAGPDPGQRRGSSRGARTDVMSVLALMPDRAHGRELFRLCAACHGTPDAGLPTGWVPEIAGQHPRVIVKQLVDFRHHNRWDVRMEIVASRHELKSLQDIADVASYAGELNPVAPPTQGSRQYADRGRSLYQARCRGCHGEEGAGSNARFVPRLAGQDYQYVLRQLHDAIERRRPGLAATHAKLLRTLDQAELEGLADYATRIPPQSTRRTVLH